jgi:leader peptidase (prepilin peptidase)/N-methyltransferase
MSALFVVVGAMVGGVGGAVLDPAGQRLAERSRAADERRRAERAARAAASEPPGASTDDVDGEVTSDDSPPPRPTPYLPIGPSRARQLGVAAVCAVLLAAASAHFGAHLIVVSYWIFFLALATVSVTDLTHRLVPRHLIYAALVVMVPVDVAVSAVNGTWHDLVGAAIAGGVAFGLFFLIWFFVPRGMGFGDVRLAGLIGVGLGYLSLLHAYLGFLGGFLLGLLVGVVVLVRSSEGRKTRVPFGPPLAGGAVVATLWGGAAAHVLFHTAG